MFLVHLAQVLRDIAGHIEDVAYQDDTKKKKYQKQYRDMMDGIK
jgi:hypothetical protein